MMVYECLMLMLMLCKSSYARLTPEVLQHVGTWSGVSAGEVVEEVAEVVGKIAEVAGELTEVVGEVAEVVREIAEVVAELAGVVGEITEVPDAGVVSSSA